jgi:hypothetical protein
VLPKLNEVAPSKLGGLESRVLRILKIPEIQVDGGFVSRATIIKKLGNIRSENLAGALETLAAANRIESRTVILRRDHGRNGAFRRPWQLASWRSSHGHGYEVVGICERNNVELGWRMADSLRSGVVRVSCPRERQCFIRRFKSEIVAVLAEREAVEAGLAWRGRQEFA